MSRPRLLLHGLTPAIVYLDSGITLMFFVALHFCQPLIHLGVFVHERLLKLFTGGIDTISGLPVALAVSENLIHIGQKLFIAGILILVHLGLHGIEIHGLGDFVEVVRDIVDDRVNGLLEWADETCPESCSAVISNKSRVSRSQV